MKEFLQEIKSAGFPEAKRQEFLTSDGEFDLKYVSYITKKSKTASSFKDLVNTVFGRTRFELGTDQSQVSLQLFQQYYSFGKYLNVREWIGYFDRVHNLLLTREKLYEYISKTS